MTILDSNILLYAANTAAPQRAAANRWLSDLFGSPDLIGLPWITLWSFVRVSTNARIWATPKSSREAFEIIREWLGQPGVKIVHPGARHAEILERLVAEYGATGPLVSDAALAALAMENGAVLASTDRDFSRFPELRWVNPLSQRPG